MNKNLMLPVGYENFADIRQQGFYYVDKTALIEQLLSNKGMVNLFTRPRRFGKTLTMSMLRYFFEIGTDAKLFDGLYIAKNQKLCEAYLGKYPVISISIKDVDGFTFDKAMYSLVEVIANEAGRFLYLLDSDKLTAADKDQYRAMISVRDGLYTMDAKILESSLKKLSELLYKHYEKKVIILIDEYDVPLSKAFNNGYYKEMVGLIRALFGKALKTNDALFMAVLTGCLRISKESIFTGLNNFKVLSILDNSFDEQFGFTEPEVKELLAAYKLEEKLPEIKEWYDGYRFGSADIYCPWDVINHVDRLRVNSASRAQSYWINTSSNELVKRFIDKADKTTRDEIEQLVAGEAIEKNLRLELTYDEIDNSINNLWSVLFTTGYLTQTGMTDDGAYKLVIPNREIREVYKLQIQEWFKQKLKAGREQIASFWQAFAEGDAEAVEKQLNKMLSNTISIFDTKEPSAERFYHAFLAGILTSNAEWGVLSNREAGNGFADIIVTLDDPDAGVVVEIKKADRLAELDGACQRALAQIHDRGYGDYLANEGREDVLAYGIAFWKKRCKVVCERLKQKKS
ncbi:AAA family ATPase [Phascolarctobacterium succinatutens]|uniref:AAA family ATPase n=1 Tax=Phascolarctobacterium succinatutens TaxID=626940 RepID=UPI0026EF12CE|nr:AAA family ATPase [Phascolarctobacterium succinatutens]